MKTESTTTPMFRSVRTFAHSGSAENAAHDASRAARDASWAAFQADPEWAKVRTDLNVGVTVDAVFMTATDYSPMK